MLTDALLQLSTAQAVTTTAVSTNTIDLSQARDIGAGVSLFANFSVDATATAAGAATVTFQVISSAAAALTSPTVIVETGAIPISNLAAARAPISLPIAQSALTTLPIGQRYLGVQYTIATGPLTAGAFSAFITDTEVSIGKNYPSGFTVL